MYTKLTAIIIAAAMLAAVIFIPFGRRERKK